MSLNMKLISLFCIITTVYAFEEWLETIVTEGEDALLTFRFTSESPVPFSLCVGQGDPFYEDGQLILDNLTPSQQKRFRVLAWHSRIQQYTLVQIVIEKVQRTDGGLFTSRFYGTETLPPGSKEIALTVNFPPGRAQCLSMPNEREGLDEIQCAAKGGSPPGTIVCQAFNKAEVPLALTHLQNATHILNRFIISHGTSVHCCAKNDVSHNDLTCNDFVLERDGTLFVEKPSPMPSYENITGLDISESLNTEVPITTESQTQVLNSTKVIIIIAIVIPLFIAILLIGIGVRIILRSDSQTKPKKVYVMVDQNLPKTIPNEARASGLDSQEVAVGGKGNGQKNNVQSPTVDIKDRGKENEDGRRQETEETSQSNQGCTRKLPETQANTQK